MNALSSILYTACRESPTPIRLNNGRGMIDGNGHKAMTEARRSHQAAPIRDAVRRELSWAHLPSLNAIHRRFRPVRTDANPEAAK